VDDTSLVQGVSAPMRAALGLPVGGPDSTWNDALVIFNRNPNREITRT